MPDINTVSLSGVLTAGVETHRKADLEVARFYNDVEGAGDNRPKGNSKVVAFDDNARLAEENVYEGLRLTKVEYGGGTAIAYTYDAVGNRTAMKVATGPGRSFLPLILKGSSGGW